jgi:hypothetical protein
MKIAAPEPEPEPTHAVVGAAMKSNDNIPRDEMMLAEAIAATKARNLAWCEGAIFERNGEDLERSSRGATHCCAVGALLLAGHRFVSYRESEIANGNDATRWMVDSDDYLDTGESLGWAFRCAMEDV